jgi:hypothetical protein
LASPLSAPNRRRCVDGLEIVRLHSSGGLCWGGLISAGSAIWRSASHRSGRCDADVSPCLLAGLQPHRNGVLQVQGPAAGQPHALFLTCGKPSASHSTPSRQANAKIFSLPLQRAAFAGAQDRKIDTFASSRFDAGNALPEEKALDAVDMGGALADQSLTFPMGASARSRWRRHARRRDQS